MNKGGGRRSSLKLSPLAVVLLMPACAPGSLSALSVTSYSPSSAFSASGYSERRISESEYEIIARGSAATPKERVERIALARAAQIGLENKLHFFKVTAISHGVACQGKREVYRQPGIAASSAPTVTVAAVYAKRPDGPDFKDSQVTFSALSAEIAAEEIPPMPPRRRRAT